jgi:hypothetical protein
MAEIPQVGDHLRPSKQPSSETTRLAGAGRLKEALREMYSQGEDAADRHDRAVESLKDDPEETMVAVTAAYGRCPTEDYPQRQALVRTAGTIEDPGMLPFLASVALSEIPPEQSPDPHGFSTVAEETIISMTAVEAISRLAQKGDERASEILMKCVESPSFSVRRTAVTELMSTPYGADRRADIEALVPPELRFIFDMKKTSITEVRQVEDPTRHLNSPYSDPGEPKPATPGDRNSSNPGPSTT